MAEIGKLDFTIIDNFYFLKIWGKLKQMNGLIDRWFLLHYGRVWYARNFCTQEKKALAIILTFFCINEYTKTVRVRII